MNETEISVVVKPTIGVVIPLFGAPDQIRECLESVAKQQSPFDVVTLVDDFAGGAVADVASNFVNACVNWKLISAEQPLGIVGASNLGLAETETDYVAFVDCDDVLSPIVTERLRLTLKRVRPALVATRYKTFNENLEDAIDPAILQYRQVYPSDRALIIEHLFLSHLKAYRRDWLTQRGGFAVGTDGIQDWESVADLVCAGEHFEIIDEPLYFHRVHGRQTSSGRNAVYMRAVNERRVALLGRDAPALRLSDVATSQLNLLARTLAKTAEAWNVLPGILIVHHEGSLQILPASTPILEHLLAENNVAWVLFAGRSWLDLGAIADLISESRTVIGGVVSQAQPEMVDWARWYSGYLDVVLPLDRVSEACLDGFMPQGVLVITAHGPGDRASRGKDGRQ